MVVMMGSNGALDASRTSSSMSSMAASPAHSAGRRDHLAASAAVASVQHHIKATSSERMNNYMSEDDNLDEPLFVNDPTINNTSMTSLY